MDKVEYIAKNYRDMKMKLHLVQEKLLNYRPISENSVIQSLVFEKSEHEMVKKSKNHGRSELISLSFREKQEQENQEYLSSLLNTYYCLKMDLYYFEFVMELIPEDLKPLAKDLIYLGKSWTELEEIYEISHSTLAYRRRKILKQLRKCYRWTSKSLELKPDGNGYTYPGVPSCDGERRERLRGQFFKYGCFQTDDSRVWLCGCQGCHQQFYCVYGTRDGQKVW